ncbi:hypothetical protein [Acinetobacter sp. YH16038]|uniref:hypothetical protein n=1 Tax=Acinetobacter sp. YH16038 TaxID=2601183 RepID=UPI0015D442C4|nr:hypothetical protein [Acinetobacter sp. YH16038]
MDNSSKKVELQKQHTAIVEKTTFMLITASTASIGFILTQMKQVIWNDLIWLSIAALFFLGLSFFWGCSQLGHKANFLKLNAEYLTFKASSEKEEKQFFEDFGSSADKVASTNRWQKVCLFLGAMLYTLYVFIDIYLKSISI